MAEKTTGYLVASSNRGRYSLDTPEGADITSGASIAIWLNGQWIEGRVEHSGGPDAEGVYSITGVGERIGYYFIARDGAVCGLCVGMKVKLL